MRNQIKALVLLGSLSVLVIGMGAVLAPGQLALFGALALALNVGAYFYSDRMVLAVHRAGPVSEREAPGLHAMVEELATRAGIPKPRVFIIPDAQPNAFATGRNPEHGVVAVTEGLLRLLSPRELRGVLAHEIAHIKNRDILVSTVAAIMAGVITYAAQALSLSALFGGQGEEDESAGGGILAMLVAPLAATLIQLGISRAREYQADELGAALANDPDALAGALAKLDHTAQVIPAQAPAATASLFIVNPFAGAGSWLKWFSTHPPVAERIRRLGRMNPVSRRVAPTRMPRLMWQW